MSVKSDLQMAACEGRINQTCKLLVLQIDHHDTVDAHYL